MSGPALRNRMSHRAIHEAVIEEIKEALSIFPSLDNKDPNTVLEARLALLDIWKEKLMAHATEEENGLYLEISNSRPETKETLLRLSRDHQLLALLLEKARAKINDPTGEEFMDINKAMILLVELHSREEEDILP